MNKQDLQNQVGNNIIIKSASASAVKWRFADNNANKAYGLRSYKPVKNQSISSVANEINSQAARM